MGHNPYSLADNFLDQTEIDYQVGAMKPVTSRYQEVMVEDIKSVDDWEGEPTTVDPTALETPSPATLFFLGLFKKFYDHVKRNLQS